MNEKDYTKVTMKSQKDYLESQNRLIEVLTEMRGALEDINDQNALHCNKEEQTYNAIEKLATAVEARSKVMNTVFILLALAVVILAGAEKATKFILP
jgi:hypothetical protein